MRQINIEVLVLGEILLPLFNTELIILIVNNNVLIVYNVLDKNRKKNHIEQWW